MNNNPFTPTQTPTTSIESVQRSGGRVFEIVHNVFRGLLAFFFFAVVPVFIVPEIRDGFEEFGIDLPFATQLVIQYSNRVLAFFFLFLPIAFVTLAGVEFAIYCIPSNFWKTLINIVYWLVLIFTITLLCMACAIPFVSVMSGLTAMADLSSLLLVV